MLIDSKIFSKKLNLKLKKTAFLFAVFFNMVETVGIEPMTSTLPVWRSPS